MEFHEKLQELRKERGLTQEELAEALYVSRTAISKWESGRGYPSIESLKEISKFYSITIDELLSGEKLLSLAEKENKSNVRSVCDLLFGLVDVISVILIILPLYPHLVDGHIYSVNLFYYIEITPWQRLVYWLMFSALIAVGLIKLLLIKIKIEKYHKLMLEISMVIHICTVLFLALAREPYAITMAFLLLIVKGILLLKYMKVGN